MSSIKQLIINAVIKVSTSNPALDREGEPSAEEARDEFIRLLIAELFPEDPSVPVSMPTKEKKTKKEKKTEEVVVESEAEVKAIEIPVKKKRAPKAKPAPAPVPTNEGGETVSPAPAETVLETSGSNAAAGSNDPPATGAVKEKKARKPKPAPAGVNIAKIDPTWRKHLKHADKDHAKELEPELLTYLNGMSTVEFNDKKAEEHVADFIASRVTKAAESDGKVEADLIEVEFDGKTYYVNPETKRVYEGEGTCDADGNWTNYKGVGYVGMAVFTDMKVD